MGKFADALKGDKHKELIREQTQAKSDASMAVHSLLDVFKKLQSVQDNSLEDAEDVAAFNGNIGAFIEDVVGTINSSVGSDIVALKRMLVDLSLELQDQMDERDTLKDKLEKSIAGLDNGALKMYQTSVNAIVTGIVID